MYRISREGRRASAHDHDRDNNQPTRSGREWELSDSNDKNRNNKGFGGAALPTSNPGVVLCVKFAAVLMVLFFVRGVSAGFANQPKVC